MGGKWGNTNSEYLYSIWTEASSRNVTLHNLKPNWVHTITMLWLAMLRIIGAKFSFCEYIMWSVTLKNNLLQWARKPLYLWASIFSTLLPFGSYAIIPNFQNCVIMRSPGETWLQDAFLFRAALTLESLCNWSAPQAGYSWRLTWPLMRRKISSVKNTRFAKHSSSTSFTTKSAYLTLSGG